MPSKNFFTENDDILFHLNKRMDWATLFAWLSQEEKDAVGAENADEYKNAWMDVLDTFGEIVAGPIAANAPAVDRSHCELIDGKEHLPESLVANMKLLHEFGLPAFGIKPAYGGMGAPFFLEMAGAEALNRACPSTMLNASWYGAIAHIIELFGSKELKDEYIPRIASGEWSGNMALTEADAGSDLAALRTYGVKQEDGSWRLYGSKRFISNGNGHVSLVLAKNAKGAQGLATLSLYLCPRTIDGQDNIKLAKFEEKIGLHASATAELVYEGSQAWLLGEEGEGFRYMLRLMNDSRIGVAFQGIGAMEASWQLAAQYAQERKTWGKPIASHELIAEILLDLEVETKAIRSLSYQAAYNRSIAFQAENYLRDNDLSNEERKNVETKMHKANARLRRWTPLIKYWVGERAYVHARNAMQVLGGYGYTTEYRAEWWVRESLIYSIYEGTSQIQALMCVKDTLKGLVRRPRAFIEQGLALKMRSLSATDPLKRKLWKMKQLNHGAVIAILFKLIKTNAKASYSAHNGPDLLRLIKSLSRDLIKFEHISPALLHAERLCEMKCQLALAEALVWDADTEPSRRWLAERFIHKALPRLQQLKTLIEQDDTVIAARLEANAKQDAGSASSKMHA